MAVQVIAAWRSGDPLWTRKLSRRFDTAAIAFVILEGRNAGAQLQQASAGGDAPVAPGSVSMKGAELERLSGAIERLEALCSRFGVEVASVGTQAVSASGDDRDREGDADNEGSLATRSPPNLASPAMSVCERRDSITGLGDVPVSSPSLFRRLLSRCLELLGVRRLRYASRLWRLSFDDPAIERMFWLRRSAAALRALRGAFFIAFAHAVIWPALENGAGYSHSELVPRVLLRLLLEGLPVGAITALSVALPDFVTKHSRVLTMIALFFMVAAVNAEATATRRLLELCLPSVVLSQMLGEDGHLVASRFLRFESVAVLCADVVITWFFDLFGDAMDRANELERTCVPNRVHVSAEVAGMVAGRYKCEPLEIDPPTSLQLSSSPVKPAPGEAGRRRSFLVFPSTP
eukprot:tig00000475_g1228.t1